MKPERTVQNLRREIRAEAARTKENSGTEVHVVVITSDISLLSVLQQAGSPEHSFWQTSSAEAAVDLLVSGRRGILILDLATLSGNLTNLLYRLELQFPELVVLATGTREQESTVITLVGKGRIYRFLHKPISPARAGLFLGTATRRYRETSGNESNSSAIKTTALRPTWTLLFSALGVMLALSVGGAALLFTRARVPPKELETTSTAATARGAPPTPATTNVAPANPSGTPAVPIDTAGMLSRYLAVAQAAYSAGRLFTPPGDNALEYYQSALRLQENSAEALLGIERINITLETRVTKALQDFDVAGATQALDDFQRVQPNAPQLASLRARILALTTPIPAASQPVVTRDTPSANTTQLSGAPAPRSVASTLSKVASTPKVPATIVAANVEQARNRIRNGQLIEPDNDSALFFLMRAQEAGEDSSVLRIAATDLGQRLLDGARSALTANQGPQAQRLLEVATELDRQLDLGLPDLDMVTTENKRFLANGIERARNQRLAAAMQAREENQLLEPPGTNAYELLSSLSSDYPDIENIRVERQRLAAALVTSGEAALQSGDRRRAEVFSERAMVLMPEMAEVTAFAQTLSRQPVVVAATSLVRVRDAAPKYPAEAESAGIEGTVEVEFTIATNGTTGDPIVRDSNPKTIFDKAALEAVRKWVFKPVIRDGQPVMARTSVKIRFSMKR